jgi:hypothetical protein
MTPQKAQRRIEVGDEVILHVGPIIEIPSRVVEDRGIIGSDGARILGILSDLGEGARDVYRETAEENLEIVDPDAEPSLRR